MADLTYKATVDVSQAERSLTSLQKSVGGLNDTFVRLKTTLASISLGAVISQSLQFADALSDLSDASEIAIGNLLGFQNAVMASGGTAEGAQKAILRLVNSIGEAADGSASMQQAFRDVGVTIEDLRRMSNQDILKKTIDGLDNMENSAKRSVLVTQLLGKEFRNVAPGQLGAAYAQATAANERYADAIKKGADAQQNIDKTLGEFKIAVLEAIKPLSELISSLNIGVENFKKFVQAILAVGAAFLAFTAIGKIVDLFLLIGRAIIGIVSSGAGLIELFGNMINGWRAIWAATEGAGGAFARILLSIRAVGAAIAEILGPAWGVLKAAAQPVLLSIAGWWGYIQDSTEGAINKLREYASALTFGLISPPQQGGGAGRGNGQAELDQRKKDAEAELAKAKELREVLDRQAEARGKVALELKHNIDNLAIGLSRQTESIALEAKLIELSKLKNVISEDQVEIIKAQSEADIARLAKLKDLEQQQEKLRFQLKFAKDEDKAGINAQIGANEELRKKVEEYYAGHNKALEENITRLQTAKKLDAARLQDMENMKKAIEDQIARQQTLGDTLQKINDQRKDVQFQRTQIGMGGLEKQFADIQENARKAALEAGRAFAAAFEDTGDGLTPEKAQELADGLAKIAEGYRGIAEAQTDNLKASREWTAGWKEAFANYVDDATNAANQAKTVFDTFTKGFEDAIVSFVQTGKLSFKDLANSIIAEVVRIQAKRMAVSLFGGGSGGGGLLGGIFGGIGSFFGGLFKAEGGPVGANQPYVVGEKGMELFMPRTAGTIIPNNQLAFAGGTQQNITNVNYSIQAVDASSFRQLVARDPQFIYSVTEKGRRSQPTRSR